MTGTVIEMARNRADATQVAAHLRACDAMFVPPLGGRVDLDAYARKIVQRAERFEAWSGDLLAGLVAVYCNHAERGSAFVTSVSVLPPRHGEGIALRLMQGCISYVRATGFARIELEFDLENGAATALYRKLGFTATRAGGPTQILQLGL